MYLLKFNFLIGVELDRQWAKTEKTWVILPAVDLNFSIPKMGKRAYWSWKEEWKWPKTLERFFCPLYKAYSPPAHLTPMYFSILTVCYLKMSKRSTRKGWGEAGETWQTREKYFQWLLVSVSSRALFTSGWNNTEKKVYNIPGISDMMKLIIEYAYTRTVPIAPDNVRNSWLLLQTN